MSDDRGGYGYEFVETPSDMFLCKICHLPSKEPHLSVCCGHTFCKSCLDGIKPRITKPFQFSKVVCPMCRCEKFSTSRMNGPLKTFMCFVLIRRKGVIGRVK